MRDNLHEEELDFMPCMKVYIFYMDKVLPIP